MLLEGELGLGLHGGAALNGGESTAAQFELQSAAHLLADLLHVGDDADGFALTAHGTQAVEHLGKRRGVQSAEALIQEECVNLRVGSHLREAERQRHADDEGFTAGEVVAAAFFAGIVLVVNDIEPEALLRGFTRGSFQLEALRKLGKLDVCFFDEHVEGVLLGNEFEAFVRATEYVLELAPGVEL